MIQRILSLLILGLFSLSLVAQSEDESSGMSQSRESAAVDATAAQWSFQFAFQGFNKYKDDIMDNGVQRPPGNKNFFQFRLVAPIPKTEKFPIMLLPRLTLR